MRICIISNGNAFDKKNWSGTPFNIASRLSQKPGIEVISLDLKKVVPHRFYSFLRKTFGKIFFLKGSPRDPLLFKNDSIKIQRKLDEIDADIYLFCAEYCLIRKQEFKRYYNYVDATLRPLLLHTTKKRLLSFSFLKGYELNERKCYDLLDGCFSMNEWAKKSINELYHFEMDKIKNIGFGVNVSFYEESKDYSKHCLLIVLRKGTERYKGLDLLLEALPFVQEQYPDVVLHVVGTSYRKMPGVIYHFNEPRTVTIELFRMSSLYVMPAINEPNGITYLEALANKTPIIGLDRFAFPEFSGFGKYGFIVSDYNPKMVANTIIKAFSDEKVLKRMGEEGQQYVRSRFDWDVVVDKMYSTFIEEGCKIK